MTVLVRSHRRTVLWNAALLHRLSGIGLAVFLPIHFLVLGLALSGAAPLDDFLRLTETPVVQFAEGGLIFLLAVHLLGGLRLLAIENLAWFDGQKRLALGAWAVSCVVAAIFLARIL